MMKKRAGFTLIELLIVIVIIGILAAIAIPKFGKTREKAYEKAMMSDLRNLQGQQELYYSDPAHNYTYAAGTVDETTDPATSVLPDFSVSAGVTTTFAATAEGWWAQASHDALPNTICGVAVGDAAALAAASAVVADVTTLGVVACTTTP